MNKWLFITLLMFGPLAVAGQVSALASFSAPAEGISSTNGYQLMLVFEDQITLEKVNFKATALNPIPASKIRIWENECSRRLFGDCTLIGIYWLHAPRHIRDEVETW